VLNRTEKNGFPDTIRGVIYQRNAFEPVANGSINHESSGQMPFSDCRKTTRSFLCPDGQAPHLRRRWKVAVASVVLNRTEKNGFPDTIRGVIYQRNAFEPVGL
jgi:spore germination cell wall hydrolase CwlJ-like protein